MRLILASSSVRRISVLAQIGYKPDIIAPANIDESEKKGETARTLALRLAFEKASKIAIEYPNDAVLGADTVVAIGRRILPKGETEKDAWHCMNLLSGRNHKVYTGLCLIYNGKICKKIGVTSVRFKLLSNKEKQDFIDSKQWLGKAGCYALQGFAASFIKNLKGTDTNILGLPAYLVCSMLSGIGIKNDYKLSKELC